MWGLHQEGHLVFSKKKKLCQIKHMDPDDPLWWPLTKEDVPFAPLQTILDKIANENEDSEKHREIDITGLLVCINSHATWSHWHSSPLWAPTLDLTPNPRMCRVSFSVLHAPLTLFLHPTDPRPVCTHITHTQLARTGFHWLLCLVYFH